MLEHLKKPESTLSEVDPEAAFAKFQKSELLEKIKTHLEKPLPDPDYGNLLKYFPFPEMRHGQREVLQKLQEYLLDDNVKFIVLEAPTGSGKSGFAVAMATASKSAYVATANKNLQEQYMRDFDGILADMRGRANYQCRVFEGNDCAKSPCRDTRTAAKKCRQVFACEYHEALYAAATEEVASFNFAAYLSFANYIRDCFGTRNLLVLDECHSTPEWLTSFAEIKLGRDNLRELALAEEIPDYQSAEFYEKWLLKIQESAKKYIDDDLIDEKTAEEMESLDRKISLLKSLAVNDWNNFALIKEFDRRSNILISIAFKPVNVSKVAQRFMLNHAKKTVFLSATILDFDTFIDMLGLEHEHTKVLRIPSTFPKQNRPIYLDRAKLKLNAENIDANLPKVIENIQILMDHYKDFKGMIHGNSYKVCNYIYESLQTDRIIYPKSSMEQKSALARHTGTSEPTILLSPSMEEGVDLKDDLCRWQVIVKVPFPYLGDPVVQQRKIVYPNYYSWMTALTIVQAYGRAVRTPEDWAHTFVLDSAFYWFYKNNSELFPRWFSEAIQWS